MRSRDKKRYETETGKQPEQSATPHVTVSEARMGVASTLESADKKKMEKAVKAWLNGGEDISELVQSDLKWRACATEYMQANYRKLPESALVRFNDALFPCLEQGGLLNTGLKELLALRKKKQGLDDEQKKLIEEALRLYMTLRNCSFRSTSTPPFRVTRVDMDLDQCGPLLTQLSVETYHKILGDRYLGHSWAGYVETCISAILECFDGYQAQMKSKTGKLMTWSELWNAFFSMSDKDRKVYRTVVSHPSNLATRKALARQVEEWQEDVGGSLDLDIVDYQEQLEDQMANSALTSDPEILSFVKKVIEYTSRTEK